MSKLIVYFHGLGSNGNSSKVHALRAAGLNVIAPEVNLTPAIAELRLTNYLQGAIQTAIEAGITKIVFVGTSLGGFWAARMGDKFNATQVLINPALNPAESLKKYSVTGYIEYATGEKREMPFYVIDAYYKLPVESAVENRHFFIASNDPIVQCNIPDYHPHVKLYDSDDHQGNSFFPDVIEYLQNM